MNVIRGYIGNIIDEYMISKVLRTLLLIYDIRVSTIQELRCSLGNDLTLDSLVGRQTTFELSDFDNFTTPAIESSFNSQLVLHEPKKKKGKYEDSENESSNDDLENLEALNKRKRKFKGKLPIIYF